MSDPIRNSTRAKKIPRYLQMDENQYGFNSGSRNLDTKQGKTNPQQLNQIAKLLIKFLTNSNQRTRVTQSDDMPEPLNLDHANNVAASYRKSQPSQKTLRNVQTLLDRTSTSNKNQPDREQQANQISKGVSKNNVKKSETIKKGTLGLSASIASDLSYHTMLGQHIRAALPGSRNISTEALMKLGVPAKETLQQKKGKDHEKHKNGNSGDSKEVETREQLKPFKRQSYHVAIAYHIYLKHIKSGSNPNQKDIDPTYNARKLRQQSNRP